MSEPQNQNLLPSVAHLQDYRLKIDFTELFKQGEYLRIIQQYAATGELPFSNGLLSLITEIQLQAMHGCTATEQPDFDHPTPIHNHAPSRSPGTAPT